MKEIRGLIYLWLLVLFVIGYGWEVVVMEVILWGGTYFGSLVFEVFLILRFIRI